VLDLKASGKTVAEIMELTGLGRITIFTVLRQARDQG
jgi:hypothetical protein